MASVAINLATLSGGSHHFSISEEASALEGKLHVAEELGRPADLQRWLVNGVVVEDTEVLASFLEAARCFQPADSQNQDALEVLCVFLPRTFDVKIKVVKFTPGKQAQSAEEVCISVSPTMTIDGAKCEAFLALEAGGFNAKARLIKGGLHLHDDRTIEQYHIDPDSTLHLIIPRSRSDDKDSAQADASEINEDAASEYNSDDTLIKDAFRKASSNESSKNEIVSSGGAKNEDSANTVLSPRAKEAASMFTTMGVHRLRPRSASTPAIRSRAKLEIASAGQAAAPSEASSAVPHADTDRAAASSSAASTCVPQEPDAVRAAPSRPARERNASRCASPNVRRISSAVRPQTSAGSRPQTSAGLERPPRVPMGLTRPPTAPRPVTAQPQSADLERPTGTSRGLRRTDASSAVSGPVDRQRQQPSPAEPSPWVCEWVAKAAVAHTAQRHIVSDRVALRRSASCRAAGIDRFACVACC